MLTPADALIVRRDPAVPGLALVLDEEALGVRLREARPELDLVSARATYVRYKPGTSCLVGYRLLVEDMEVSAFAKAYRRGDAAKAAKFRGKGGAAAAALGDLVVLARVGGDHDLPGALAVEHPDRRRRLLHRLLPDLPDCWDTVPRCLRYKPERRWVGMVQHRGEPAALVKAYRRSDLARACAGLRFARGISPDAPRLLGASKRLAALASSWVPGETLSDLLARPGAADGSLVAAGAALAALHRAPGIERLPVAGDTDARALAAAAAHLEAVDPRLGATATALATALAPRLGSGTSLRPAARHGDFSPDQLVVGPHGMAVVDFDNAEVGDPAADLGHFVATLWAATLGRPPGPVVPSPESHAADFLGGYEAAGGRAAAGRVDDHTAAALVRLAVEPFRTRTPDWPVRTEALLERASVLMARTVR